MGQETNPEAILRQHAEYLQEKERTSLDRYAHDGAVQFNASLRAYVMENDRNRDGVLDKSDATKDNPNPALMNISPAGVEKEIQPLFKALVAAFDRDGSGTLNRREEERLVDFVGQYPLPNTFTVARPELRKRIAEGGVLTTQDVVEKYKEALTPYIEAAQNIAEQEPMSPLRTPADALPGKDEKSR